MAPRKPRLITLTTDFGLRDPYVAEMKGVIYGIDPRLTVVDLTHEIGPQDVFEGALFLAGAMPHFPKGTIHVAVIDPGVGTGRHPVAVFAGGQILVCPDNGLPTLFLQTHPLQEARIIRNPKFVRDPVSATFHGRDIFAPAAAHLACGAPLRDLGDDLDTLVMLDIPRPRRVSEHAIHGEVVHIDRFGNLITNLHASIFESAVIAGVRAGRHRVRGMRRTYGEVPPGTSLALFGSSDYLEIAVNGGSAHAALRLGCGDEVVVTLRPQA